MRRRDRSSRLPILAKSDGAGASNTSGGPRRERERRPKGVGCRRQRWCRHDSRCGRRRWRRWCNVTRWRCRIQRRRIRRRGKLDADCPDEAGYREGGDRAQHQAHQPPAPISAAVEKRRQSEGGGGATAGGGAELGGPVRVWSAVMWLPTSLVVDNRTVLAVLDIEVKKSAACCSSWYAVPRGRRRCRRCGRLGTHFRLSLPVRRVGSRPSAGWGRRGHGSEMPLVQPGLHELGD